MFVGYEREVVGSFVGRGLRIMASHVDEPCDDDDEWIEGQNQRVRGWTGTKIDGLLLSES